MTKEQEQFINILQSFVQKENFLLPLEADLNCVFHLGEIHSLSAVVCYVLNSRILNGEIKQSQDTKDLQTVLFSTITLQTQRHNAFEKLLDKINDEKIKTVLIKGVVLSKYYTDPMVRTFGDIDFIIDPESLPRLDKLMLGLGYEKSISEEQVVNYTKGNEKYEAHIALLDDKYITNDGIKEFSSSVFSNLLPTEREYVYCLNPEYHFAYLLIHLLKHIRNLGAGVRMYLDLALMLKNEPDLNIEKVKDYMKPLGLLEFFNSTLWLLKKWFNVSPNIETTPLSKEVTEQLEEYVISGGAFGAYGRNPGASRIRKSKGQTRAFIRFVFPTYSDIKYRYKFLNSKPYLLPVGWIARWFDGIFLRKKRAEKILKGIITMNDEAESTAELLKSIGLE